MADGGFQHSSRGFDFIYEYICLINKLEGYEKEIFIHFVDAAKPSRIFAEHLHTKLHDFWILDMSCRSKHYNG